jgi:hypothetical protein
MSNNYKIKVANSDESERIQRHAIGLGYSWGAFPFNFNTVKHIQSSFLFFSEVITHCTIDEEVFFKQSSYIEITPKQFLTITEVGGDIDMFNKKDKDAESIKSMKENIGKMEQQLKEMKTTLANLKVKSSGWVDEKQEEVFVISSEDDIFEMEKETADDELRVVKAFSSKAKAHEIAFKQRVWRQLQKFADESNPSIDCPDGKYRYTICWDANMEKLYVNHVYTWAVDFGQVFFCSSKVANKALQTFKEDLIKYFTYNS